MTTMPLEEYIWMNEILVIEQKLSKYKMKKKKGLEFEERKL